MRIIYERTGGFMGRTVSLELDLDELPPHQAETLSLLLSELDFSHLKENPAQAAVPDEFIYSITVITESQEHNLYTSDTTAPEELRPLLEELAQLAKMQR